MAWSGCARKNSLTPCSAIIRSRATVEVGDVEIRYDRRHCVDRDRGSRFYRPRP